MAWPPHASYDTQCCIHVSYMLTVDFGHTHLGVLCTLTLCYVHIDCVVNTPTLCCKHTHFLCFRHTHIVFCTFTYSLCVLNVSANALCVLLSAHTAAISTHFAFWMYQLMLCVCCSRNLSFLGFQNGLALFSNPQMGFRVQMLDQTLPTRALTGTMKLGAECHSQPCCTSKTILSPHWLCANSML